jgi:hypothetical protein
MPKSMIAIPKRTTFMILLPSYYPIITCII